MGRYSGKTCRLSSMLLLTTTYFLVEIIVGYVTNSMALVADSFHMLSDVIALVIGLFSVRVRYTDRLARIPFMLCSSNVVSWVIGLDVYRGLEKWDTVTTSDVGSQYRCGRVDRGVQPPSIPQPPNPQTSTKKMFDARSSTFILDHYRRTDPRIDGRTKPFIELLVRN